jgi:hypothetical protein
MDESPTLGPLKSDAILVPVGRSYKYFIKTSEKGICLFRFSFTLVVSCGNAM